MLGRLACAITQKCKVHGPEFVKEIDVALRNSISHGLYWIGTEASGKDILCYVKELGVTPPKQVVRTELFEKIRKSNLLTVCFAQPVGERADKGYFG